MEENYIIRAVLDFVLGGTTVFSIIQSIRYRKENKRLKEIEVSSADIEAQSDKMDLGDKYLDKVLNLTEKAYEATLKNNADINSRFDKTDKQLEQLVSRVTSVEEYLDGDYQDHLAKKAMALQGEFKPSEHQALA